MITDDESAVACARIARAFDSLLNAAMARLRLHYATRISGLLLLSPRDQAAAVAALMNERDAALEILRREFTERRREALRIARRQRRRRRYSVAIEPVRPDRPKRPARAGRVRQPVRVLPRMPHARP